MTRGAVVTISGEADAFRVGGVVLNRRATQGVSGVTVTDIISGTQAVSDEQGRFSLAVRYGDVVQLTGARTDSLVTATERFEVRGQTEFTLFALNK
jgi:hypothetical protein